MIVRRGQEHERAGTKKSIINVYRNGVPTDTVLKIENQALQDLFLELTQSGSKGSPD